MKRKGVCMNTYQPRSQRRTDWTSEVKVPSGSTREPSGTGIGGMEREAQSSGDWLYGNSGNRDALSVADSVSGAQGATDISTGERGTREAMRARENRSEMTTGTRDDWNGTTAGTRDDWNGTTTGTRDNWNGTTTGMRESQTDMRTQERPNGMSDREQEEEMGELAFLEREDDSGNNGEGFTTGPRVMDGQELNEIWPNIENNLSNDVVEAPTTMEEVYRGSMKALLLRNVGNYVVATFLIGTQTTVSWEGILYDVGNDYLAIYQSGRDQYIVSDLYSLKYVEFYDTRRRELCDALLTAQGPAGNSQRP